MGTSTAKISVCAWNNAIQKQSTLGLPCILQIEKASGKPLNYLAKKKAMSNV